MSSCRTFILTNEYLHEYIEIKEEKWNDSLVNDKQKKCKVRSPRKSHAYERTKLYNGKSHNEANIPQAGKYAGSEEKGENGEYCARNVERTDNTGWCELSKVWRVNVQHTGPVEGEEEECNVVSTKRVSAYFGAKLLRDGVYHDTSVPEVEFQMG